MLIKCPYCFREMEDHQVCFRSEKVNLNENPFIPDEYDDKEEFQKRYRGDDKEEILAKIEEWEFFGEQEDEVYETFWKPFNGTTEYNPADKMFKINSWRRRVLDPSNPVDKQYIKTQPNGTPFIQDEYGMVAQIELTTGERCNRRVCRHCHNPLPDDYGKNPVKFATVIGITGAGKTVYLSQLLKGMSQYAVKGGLSALVTSSSAMNFIETNVVAANQQLPGSTPAMKLQQPIFYELIKAGEDGRKKTETFVLYDVAGEVFKDVQADMVHSFAPFIEHADAAIVLIDPMQFNVFSNMDNSGRKLDNPTSALTTIHRIVSKGNPDTKCKIPFAICMSKADTAQVQSVLPMDLCRLLLEDVQGVRGPNGFFLPYFNSKAYGSIYTGLKEFMIMNAPDLAQLMEVNYENYAYFAFTALGCNVEEMEDENGMKFQAPVGPVIPKRLEEPVLWLFHKLGYISKNAPFPGEIECENCGSTDTVDIPMDNRWSTEKKGLFKKVDVYVDRCCTRCGYRWDTGRRD